MRSVESFLKIYSYTKLFAWKKSLRKILCLSEMFDLGSIHKGHTHFRGVSKKYTNAGKGSVGLQLKVDVLFKEIPYFLKYTQSANLQTKCLLMSLQLDCCKSRSWPFCNSRSWLKLTVHANQVSLYIALIHSI